MEQKLFMVLLGCRPAGRNTEQHDIFFGIGPDITALAPAIKKSWPESKGNVHIDSWREVRHANGHKIEIVPKNAPAANNGTGQKLYFINLGGYKPGDLEEYHYKVVVAARDKATAITMSKQTAFYKHTGFKNAPAHVDDRYGIDVDDAEEIAELLPEGDKALYSVCLLPDSGGSEDELHVGYLKI